MPDADPGASTPRADAVLQTVTPAQLQAGLIQLQPTVREPAVSLEDAEQAARELFGDAAIQEEALARYLGGNGKVIVDPVWVIAFVPPSEPREVLSPIPTPEGETAPPEEPSEVVMTAQVAFVDATTGQVFDALETNAPPEGFATGKG
jgi:hypothetical protein